MTTPVRFAWLRRHVLYRLTDQSTEEDGVEERLAIAGGGAIACGLAATAARHGDVVVWVRSDSSAQRARGAVDAICGRLTGAVNARNVRIATDLAEVSDATFLIEAIAEDAGAKTEVLASLGAVAGGGAILATTTSSLSIAELAEASGAPDRFAGLHVFNPVTRMKLVELAFPAQATAATRRRARELCEALGKTPVEVPDTPGFVVNRLLFPYLFSAVELMESTGLAPADVDACRTLGAGHPMGPLALLDFVGLDVAIAIGETIGADVPERLRALVAEGALGRKTGRGIYRH
jgi:3-hydroxybutyryl-CoA dehydrogenase